MVVTWLELEILAILQDHLSEIRSNAYILVKNWIFDYLTTINVIVMKLSGKHLYVKKITSVSKNFKNDVIMTSFEHYVTFWTFCRFGASLKSLFADLARHFVKKIVWDKALLIGSYTKKTALKNLYYIGFYSNLKVTGKIRKNQQIFATRSTKNADISKNSRAIELKLYFSF